MPFGSFILDLDGAGWSTFAPGGPSRVPRLAYARSVQRVARVSGPAVVLLAAFAALLVALAFAGGADSGIGQNPGALVRYGVPLAKLVLDLAIALTLGALALCIFALNSREAGFSRSLDLAAAGAGVWTFAAAASSILAFSTAARTPLSLDQAFGQSLGSFLTSTDSGRSWLATTLIGAALTVLCFAVRNVTALGVVALLAIAGLIPYAGLGHADDGSSRNAAAMAIWLHVLFASVWLGALLTLVLLRRTLSPERMLAVLPRYSTIAVIAFVVVTASGTASAVIRVGSFTELLTPYGALVLVKVTALVALGLLVAVLRRRLIAQITRENAAKLFWVLAAAELAVLGIAEGVASVLAVSPPPAAASVSSPAGATSAEYLTGIPLPPELTPLRAVTAGNLDLLWALACAFGIVFYATGVWRMHRRGVAWPRYRTVLWMSGMGVLLWATNGALNVYEQFLFGQHLIQLLLLATAIPMLLVLGAPIRLALAAISPRDDGSRGAREWIQLLTQSRLAAIVTHPAVATALFVASLWAVTYSPLLRWVTVDTAGHEWMIAGSMMVGGVFVAAMVSVDVTGRPTPSAVRLPLVVVVLVLHALFCWTLSSNMGLLLADWYGAMSRTWGATPLADQQAAGGLAAIVGGIPLVALAVTVAIRWRRRQAARAALRPSAG
ncbi:MAG: cytochrome c oxidase assembly protein [Pseudolysinimonas sp.]